MLQEVFDFLDSKKQLEDVECAARINVLKLYFQKFFQAYPERDPKKIMTITDKEVMVALMILNNPFHLQEILDALEKYPELFKREKYSELISGLTLYFNEEYIADLVENSLSNTSFKSITAKTKLSSILQKFGLSPLKCNIPEFLLKNPQAKADLEIVFKNFLWDFHNCGTRFIDAKREYGLHRLSVEEIIVGTLSREDKRLIKKIIGSTQSAKEVFLEEIKSYYNFLNTKLNEIMYDYEKKEKNRKNYNKNIDKLKSMLNTSEEIRDIDTICRMCPTKEIKEQVVDYILAHNKEVYVKLINDYEQTRMNSDENLNNLFQKYGFDYSILSVKDKEQLKQHPFHDIENLLKRLKDLKVFEINVAKVSLSKLSVVEDLRAKGIFTEDWLIKNDCLLLNDNNKLDIVIANIDRLSKEGINMILYSNSLDITKKEILKDNLELLKIYGLTITKTTTNLNFLGESDLRLRIEFVYSLNFYDELTDLNLLNYSLEDLLRIKIANSLNIPVENIFDVSEVYCDFTYAFIPQEILVKLSAESSFSTPLPYFLEQYQVNKNVLNIHGVYVSVEKVKRNLAKIGDNEIESCFYAIIYNGYYTYEELEILQKTLLPNQTLFIQARR